MTRTCRGFTLVELMLAFVVLSFGMVFVLRSFGSALTALGKVDDVKTLSWLMEEQMETLIRESWEQMGSRAGATAGELRTEDGKVYSWRLAVVPSEADPSLNEATMTIAKTGQRPAHLTAATYLVKHEDDKEP